MTTDEILAYQDAVRTVAAAAAEKVRRHGGSPREIAEAYGRIEVFCGRPEPIVRTRRKRPHPRDEAGDVPCAGRDRRSGSRRTVMDADLRSADSDRCGFATVQRMTGAGGSANG